jgi:hypothetical protein
MEKYLLEEGSGLRIVDDAELLQINGGAGQFASSSYVNEDGGGKKKKDPLPSSGSGYLSIH